MCLGVPGEIVELRPADDPGLLEGRVRFGGITKQVNLSFVPEARVGDWVVVHVGFAISRLDAEEAQETLRYLAELGELSELEQADSEGAGPAEGSGL